MEPGGTSGNAGLSPRQLQIVKLIVEDLSSKQIAAGPGIGIKNCWCSPRRDQARLWRQGYSRNCSLGDSEWRDRSLATRGHSQRSVVFVLVKRGGKNRSHVTGGNLSRTITCYRHNKAL